MSKVYSSKSTIPDLPDDVVLRVSGVSKKFCRNLRRSMWYGIQDLSKNLIGFRSNPETADCRPQTYQEALPPRMRSKPPLGAQNVFSLQSLVFSLIQGAGERVPEWSDPGIEQEGDRRPI